MVEKSDVLKALEDVYDPELHLDIITIGLVYDVFVSDEGDVKVVMTFTFPGCPYGPALVEEVEDVVGVLTGVRNVSVEITFEPPWTPEKMDPDVRAAMGF